jgi:hypothetical protein
MSADFDKAIDGAVREMLDVEAQADLRARVMAQLESGSPRPASGVRLSGRGWILAPLAAAALILAAVFVARRSEPVPQTPIVAQATDRHLSGEAAPARAPGPVARRDHARPVRAAAPVAPAAAPVRQGSVAPAPPAPGTVMAADYAGDDNATTAISPLKSIAPIAITPLGDERIAPAEIAVRPLTRMTDVQIAPLTPPDRR